MLVQLDDNSNTSHANMKSKIVHMEIANSLLVQFNVIQANQFHVNVRVNQGEVQQYSNGGVRNDFDSHSLNTSVFNPRFKYDSRVYYNHSSLQFDAIFKSDMILSVCVFKLTTYTVKMRISRIEFLHTQTWIPIRIGILCKTRTKLTNRVKGTIFNGIQQSDNVK